MNDFTKEELDSLLICVTLHWPDSTELEGKLQSMIDRYCEHSHGGEVEIFVDVCKKCDALLLRNKTLREYNE